MDICGRRTINKVKSNEIRPILLDLPHLFWTGILKLSISFINF